MIFTPPPTITLKLLDDLKDKREYFLPGQWMFSKKFNSKVKYVGTYYLTDNGIVKPIVKFSYPKKGEDAMMWNKRFKIEKEECEQLQKLNQSRYPAINDRMHFTRPPTLQLPPLVEVPVTVNINDEDMTNLEFISSSENTKELLSSTIKPSLFARILNYIFGNSVL